MRARSEITSIFFLNNTIPSVSPAQQNRDQQPNNSSKPEKEWPRKSQADAAELEKTLLGERFARSSFFVFMRSLSLALAVPQNRQLQSRRIPFHARILDGCQGARQLDTEAFLGPGLLGNRLQVFEGIPEGAQDPRHLLGVTPGIEFGFFEKGHAANKILRHLFAARMKFHLTPAGLFEGRPFPLEFLLRALQLGELLLRFNDS